MKKNSYEYNNFCCNVNLPKTSAIYSTSTTFHITSTVKNNWSYDLKNMAIIYYNI